ncbi:MAG: hypothetical protein M5U12_09975 [Verrucomicrobia bacterium]|nr:hypothetical protein [Verrucomicrobiota bacterium]
MLGSIVAAILGGSLAGFSSLAAEPRAPSASRASTPSAVPA